MTDEESNQLKNALDEIILNNVKKNPNYRPYCLRCTGLNRMTKVSELFWKCFCGAICDFREYLNN